MLRTVSSVALLIGALYLTLYAYVSVFFDGSTDAFYVRVASPGAPSLVIGDSRPAVGIVAGSLDPSELGFEGPMFNFAFSLAHSPFGPGYLDLIRRKLPGEGNDGLFIVAVTPWSVSNGPEEDFADPATLRETERFTTTIRSVGGHPNVEYALLHYQEPLYFAAVHKLRGEAASHLHEDGWAEFKLPVDEASVRERMEGRIEIYEEQAATWARSPEREEALRATIDELAERGRVVLLRMPISPEIKMIEDRYAPEFSAYLATLAEDAGVELIDMFESSGRYETYDGHHLSADGARQVTAELARLLR